VVRNRIGQRMVLVMKTRNVMGTSVSMKERPGF